MGGSGSVGHLHLALEVRNIQAGSDVCGTIHLRLNQDSRAQCLVLQFKGKEHCHWTESRTERDRDGNTRNVTETFRGHSHFIRQRFPIFMFANGFLNAGSYCFPFTLRLPTDIPGSFHFEHGSTTARIHYTLSAFIAGSEHKIEHSKLHIHVSQLMSSPIYSVAGDVVAGIKTWCCSNQGSVQMKAHFNKNAYVPGETAVFVAEVNNSDCKLDVAGLRGVLFRTLRLRSDTGREHVEKIEVSRSESRQRVPSGQSLLGEQSINMMLPISDPSGQLQHSTSVKGRCIECIYSILVHLEMDGSCMCCGQTPEIERFMVIYPVQLPLLPPPIDPASWQPQMMPQVQFNLGREYEYQPSAPPMQ